MSPFTMTLQFPLNSIANVLKAVYQLEKIPNNLELDFKDQLPEDEIIKFNQSIDSIKTIVSDRFPSINPNEFINFLISSPIKSNKLDFNDLIETFKLFNLTEEDYKHGDSILGFDITASKPTSNIVNKKSYLDIVSVWILPISFFLISQIQTAQETEQLNRIENRLEEYIEQHKACESNPYIIEITNDISPGTRT